MKNQKVHSIKRALLKASMLGILSTALLAPLAQAEVAVIVSASNANAAMSDKDIAKLFLGKTKSFPDGKQAIPVDQNAGTPARDAFRDTVLGKSASQLKSYWSRLIFTGKGTPPKESGDDAGVKALVADNPDLIGYVDASVVDGSVKVLYKF
jgi:ABC-type phosphate transport system substrate-binding protein